jgi:dihydroorotate dehydrogenase (NAD+) catalytic subunit
MSATLKRTLAVDLGGLVVPTPVMIAAGCGGTTRELAALVDLRQVGAIVTRSVTIDPRPGSPTPRIAESPAGLVWETGLQNPGLDAFGRDELPRMAQGVNVIVSIAGGTLEEYVRLTTGLQGRHEAAAIEVYLSGPDAEMGRPVLGHHVDRVNEIVGAVSRMSLVPVFAKLPSGGDTVELARTAVRAGATGVTLLGSPPALGVDPSLRRPVLGSVTGWLAGPALRPVTLRAVFDVAQALPDTPLVASGGVRTPSDAVEMLLAGAWAVQVGTAALVDPGAVVTVARGIAAYLKAGDLASPADARGRLMVPASVPEEPG